MVYPSILAGIVERQLKCTAALSSYLLVIVVLDVKRTKEVSAVFLVTKGMEGIRSVRWLPQFSAVAEWTHSI